MKPKKKSNTSSNNKQTWFSDILQFPKKLSERLIESESALDLKEKCETYSVSAEIFENKFQKPIDICLSATHILCNELDPKILGDETQISYQVESFSNDLKRSIHSITVKYEPIKKAQLYRKQIEISLIQGRNKSTTKVSQEVDWDYLPPDVRERCMRYGEEVSVFELYSQE